MVKYLYRISNLILKSGSFFSFSLHLHFHHKNDGHFSKGWEFPLCKARNALCALISRFQTPTPKKSVREKQIGKLVFFWKNGVGLKQPELSRSEHHTPRDRHFAGGRMLSGTIRKKVNHSRIYEGPQITQK